MLIGKLSPAAKFVDSENDTKGVHTLSAEIKVAEQVRHRFVWSERCSWCCCALFPWEIPSMPDVVRYNKNQHCPFIVFQNMFDTPIVHRYATHRDVKTTWMPWPLLLLQEVHNSEAKIWDSRGTSVKTFSVNGHLNKSIVRTMSECKHDEYGSRGKIGFPAAFG